MAQVAQSISLLAAVRAQLSLDSDSESSPSPGAVSLNDKPTTTTTIIHDRTGEGHATETRSTYESKAHEQSPSLSMGISKTSNRHPSDSQSTHTSHTLVESSFLSESATLLEGHPTNDHEAFPEYDEAGTPAYIEDEEAYKEAFVAAMQEKIRMQEVEPFIDDIPEQTENKQKAMEDMKDCLSDPHLHATTRERFIALTNMIIRLEHILFHRSDEFLRPQETTEAQQIAAVLLGYVAWADGMLTELLEATYPVRFVLGELMKEDVSEVIRYRRMACVVAAHLKKPRAPEQRLLSQFRDLYDQWVHDKFLSRRNHQIFVEEGLDMDRLRLTRYLHSMWEILSRIIENYASYRDVLNDIKDNYFTSISGLSNGTIEAFAEDLSVSI